MPLKLENLGSVGAILAAAACPICFPKLALIGAFLGLGVFAEYEVFFFYAAQLLILLALAGHLAAYQKIKYNALLGLMIVSAIVFFVSLYVIVSEIMSYVALFGVVVAMIWLTVESRRRSQCVTSSI